MPLAPALSDRRQDGALIIQDKDAGPPGP